MAARIACAARAMLTSRGAARPPVRWTRAPRASAASQPAAPPLLARSHHASSFSDPWRRLSAASSACLGRRRGALFARAASTSDDSREKEEDAEEDVDIIDEDDVDAWLDDDDDDDDDFDASAMPFLVASGSEDDDDDEPIRVDVSVVDGDGDGDGDGDDAAPPLTTGDDEIDIATLRDAVRSDAKKLVEWILRPPPGTPLPRDLYSPTTTRAELSVALCGDAYIRALNNEWRGKDVATDVLSFPQDAFGDFVVFGDVVVSVDAARRQAAAMRHSTRREARVLLTHGFVHLLGYDHEEGEEEAREMAALEDALLKMLDDDDDGGGGGGGGLISTSLSGARGGSSASSSDAKDVRTFTPSASGKSTRTADTLVLDLDGTLLNKGASSFRRSPRGLFFSHARRVSLRPPLAHDASRLRLTRPRAPPRRRLARILDPQSASSPRRSRRRCSRRPPRASTSSSRRGRRAPRRCARRRPR